MTGSDWIERVKVLTLQPDDVLIVTAFAPLTMAEAQVIKETFARSGIEKHRVVVLPEVMDVKIVRAPYMCDVCGEPIIDEEPHTTPDGEDAHARCCTECNPSTGQPYEPHGFIDYDANLSAADRLAAALGASRAVPVPGFDPFNHAVLDLRVLASHPNLNPLLDALTERGQP